MKIPPITMLELYPVWQGKKAQGTLVLDVRSPDEFREGHVPGSKNIPFDEVGKHLNELQGYERIYIHCAIGKRAEIATHELEGRGLNNVVCVARSGMPDWIAAGFPIEK